MIIMGVLTGANANLSLIQFLFRLRNCDFRNGLTCFGDDLPWAHRLFGVLF